MNASRLLLCLVTALANTSSAFALIRPSFSLEDCAWNASHIVIVTEGEKIDGLVEALESWKGDLKKGDRITAPELAAFAPEKERAISPPLFRRKTTSLGHVTCSRMLLFLIKKQEKAGPGEPGKISWLPANSMWEEMYVSVVWIEKGQGYAFAQQINPGPSELIPWEMNEGGLRCKVDEIVGAGTALSRALALEDPEALVGATLPRIRSASEFVRDRTLVELGLAGPKSLPTLRKVLREKSLANHHWRAIASLAKAGGVKVGPELTRLLEQELTFWMRTAPRLREGWWNGNGLQWEAVGPLRERYGKTLAVIEALDVIRFPSSRRLVKGFQSYWRSQPQLNEITQMSEACDALLAKLR